MNLSRKARRGLTLIELTVVLLILAATAGILIPRIVGYTTRAHGAAGAANIAEIAKAVALHETNTGLYPDNWDSLCDATAGTAYTGLTGTGDFTNITLATLGTAVLTDAGITQLVDMDDAAGTSDATFGANGANAPAAVATTTDVLRLDTSGITSLGLSGAQGDYILLGLGPNSTMIGESILDTPLHFPEGGDTPDSLYSRFIGVFRVSDDGGTTALDRATLVTVCTIHDGGVVSSLGDHTAEYFESLN